jgi:serine/threonine protein kinase
MSGSGGFNLGVSALLFSEEKWRARYTFLLAKGYRLRPRYDPAWVPSWKDKNNPRLQYTTEDGQPSTEPLVLDAVRVSDGALVALKELNIRLSDTEIPVTQFLNSSKLRSHPNNRCVPLYDVLQSPIAGESDTRILVLPLLRSFHNPRFDTIGEILSCLKQLFEGLEFMHSNLVAHRDINFANIMVDAAPLFPQGWHFATVGTIDRNRDYTGPAVHLSRSEVPVPVKYYFIDFGLAVQFDPKVPPASRLATSAIGGDKTVPEYQNGGEKRLTDPFATDVYYIGSMIRQIFLKGDKMHELRGYKGLQGLKPLVAAMVQDDPRKRPTMKQVVAQFEQIVASQSEWKLRAIAAPRDECPVVGLLKSPVRRKKSWELARNGYPAMR